MLTIVLLASFAYGGYAYRASIIGDRLPISATESQDVQSYVDSETNYYLDERDSRRALSTLLLVTGNAVIASLAPGSREQYALRRHRCVTPCSMQQAEVELEPDWDAIFGESERDPDDNFLKPSKKNRKRREQQKRHKESRPKKMSKVAHLRTGCYGCGADLQIGDVSGAGYVDPERYSIKEKHRQTRLLLCNRCRAMSHGAILPAVLEGRARSSLDEDEGYLNSAGFITPEQLLTELRPLREQKIIAVLLVEITEVTGSFLRNIRDFIAGNPIILIGTKADMLPKGTSHEMVLDWLGHIAGKLNIFDMHLVSARTGEGMESACRAILRERRGRDVYVLGAENVGKSMFIGSFVQNAQVLAPQKLPLASSTPGTTLKLIGLPIFDDGSMLFDTPGLHLSHRLLSVLTPSEIRAIQPRGKMQVFTPFPQNGGLEGCSLFWGGLVRVDVRKAPPAARLSFVTAQTNLRVSIFSEGGIEAAIRNYSAEVGRTLTPPLTVESASELGALQLGKRIEVNLDEEGQFCDIAISGLGWISLGRLKSLMRSQDMNAEIDVWVPKGVSVSLREPMPISGLPTAF